MTNEPAAEQHISEQQQPQRPSALVKAARRLTIVSGVGAVVIFVANFTPLLYVLLYGVSMLLMLFPPVASMFLTSLLAVAPRIIEFGWYLPALTAIILIVIYLRRPGERPEKRRALIIGIVAVVLTLAGVLYLVVGLARFS